MIRRNLIKGALAGVAGLLAPKGKANHFPDSRKKLPPSVVSGQIRQARQLRPQRTFFGFGEKNIPPTPAPGQVWEINSNWLSGDRGEEIHCVTWCQPTEDGRLYLRTVRLHPDGPLTYGYPNELYAELWLWNGPVENWRYRGHIRDLAALARCTPYEPLMPSEWPRDGIELGPCGDNSQGRAR